MNKDAIESLLARPWGVQRISDMWAPGCGAGLPDGREVQAVGEPYWTSGWSRLRAAWWVLTGRAQAVIWPYAGELEATLHVQLFRRNLPSRSKSHDQ